MKKIASWSLGKKIIVSIITLSLLVIIGGVTYGFVLFNKVDSKIVQPLEREKSDKRIEKIDIEDKKPISALLMGIDQREGEQGRSDTLILITLDPVSKTSKVLSIPRDTRTEIVGQGFDDKINHAFAYGDEEGAIQTVENFLNIPVDYYASINMNGLSKLVDVLGGITVNSTFAFTHEGKSFPEGEVTLTGDNVLNYVRMRYDDPRGDFGRQERQRQVIEGIVTKGANFASITKLNSIVNALGDNVRTNLQISQALELAKSYGPAYQNSETLQLEGTGTKIDGTWYWLPKPESVTQVSETLRTHLKLENNEQQ